MCCNYSVQLNRGWNGSSFREKHVCPTTSTPSRKPRFASLLRVPGALPLPLHIGSPARGAGLSQKELWVLFDFLSIQLRLSSPQKKRREKAKFLPKWQKEHNDNVSVSSPKCHRAKPLQTLKAEHDIPLDCCRSVAQSQKSKWFLGNIQTKI